MSAYNKDIESLIDYSSRRSGICRVGLILNKNQGLQQTTSHPSVVKSGSGGLPKKHIEMLERSVKRWCVSYMSIFENSEPLIEALTNGSE